MTVATQLQNYADLLEIRRKAYRRNAFIVAAIFVVLLIMMVVFGLLTRPVGNWIYFEMALAIGLAVNFPIAWARLEALKSTLELLTNLQRIIGQNVWTGNQPAAPADVKA